MSHSPPPPRYSPSAVDHFRGQIPSTGACPPVAHARVGQALLSSHAGSPPRSATGAARSPPRSSCHFHGRGLPQKMTLSRAPPASSMAEADLGVCGRPRSGPFPWQGRRGGGKADQAFHVPHSFSIPSAPRGRVPRGARAQPRASPQRKRPHLRASCPPGERCAPAPGARASGSSRSWRRRRCR